MKISPLFFFTFFTTSANAMSSSSDPYVVDPSPTLTLRLPSVQDIKNMVEKIDLTQEVENHLDERKPQFSTFYVHSFEFDGVQGEMRFLNNPKEFTLANDARVHHMNFSASESRTKLHIQYTYDHDFQKKWIYLKLFLNKNYDNYRFFDTTLPQTEITSMCSCGKSGTIPDSIIGTLKNTYDIKQTLPQRAFDSVYHYIFGDKSNEQHVRKRRTELSGGVKDLSSK